MPLHHPKIKIKSRKIDKNKKIKKILEFKYIMIIRLLSFIGDLFKILLYEL